MTRDCQRRLSCGQTLATLNTPTGSGFIAQTGLPCSLPATGQTAAAMGGLATPGGPRIAPSSQSRPMIAKEVGPDQRTGSHQNPPMVRGVDLKIASTTGAVGLCQRIVATGAGQNPRIAADAAGPGIASNQSPPQIGREAGPGSATAAPPRQQMPKVSPNDI